MQIRSPKERTLVGSAAEIAEKQRKIGLKKVIKEDETSPVVEATDLAVVGEGDNMHTNPEHEFAENTTQNIIK